MFNQSARAVERVLDIVLLGALVAMVASICWQVFGRYVLDHAPGWSSEISRFLIAWITMLGSARVIRADGHIAVTFVLDSLPRKVRLVVAFLRDTLILVMSGSLVYYGALFAELGGRRSSAATEISMAWPYLAIPVGGGLIALLLILRRAADWTGEPPEAPEEEAL